LPETSDFLAVPSGVEFAAVKDGGQHTLDTLV